MEVSGQLQVPAAFPQERTSVSLALETVWAAKCVWKFWRREDFLSLLGFETRNATESSLVSLETTVCGRHVNQMVFLTEKLFLLRDREWT